MTTYNFIFSNKKNIRLKRHLAFWLMYCTYFYLQSLPPLKFDEFFVGQTYYIALMNLCCFAPVFIFTVYFFIYYLLPNTLQKKKYGLFVFAFITVYIIGTLINYFMAEILIYSTGYENTLRHRLEFGNYNTRWGMIIATVALGIKLSKNWYLQQKENLEILKGKTRTEMQLQKARIHPDFLIRSLDNIYTHIQSGSDNTTSMILNLSDLLSYSLYESDKELAPLEKELSELKHLIALEQLNKESKINIQMKIEGEINNKHIAPMVIVKLLEESISLLRNTQALSWLVSLHVMSVNNNLALDLSFIDLDEKTPTNLQWFPLIENTQNRLSEYYSKAAYQIELTEERHKTVIRLNLILTDNRKETNTGSNIKFNATAYDHV